MSLQLAPRSGRLTLTLTLAIALILAIGLALASYLDEANFRRAHTQLAISRMLVPTQDLHRLIESSMDFGLALTQLTTLPQRLQTMLDEDADLLAIMVYDQSGQIIFQAAQGEVIVPERMPGDWPHGTSEPDGWHLAHPDRYLLGMGFRNSFNQPAGTLVLAYDRARVDAPVASMRAALVRNLVLTQAIMTLLVAVGVYRLVRPLRAELHVAQACGGGGLERPDEAQTPAHPVSDMLANVMAFAAATNRVLRRIARVAAGRPDDAAPKMDSNATLARLIGLDRFNRRMLLFALLLILSGIGVLSYLTLLDFRREFEPVLHRKAEVIGDSLRRMLLFLDAHGVQPHYLRGLDDHFETIRTHHPEVGYLVLVDPSGQIQAAAGTIPEQIRADLQARTAGSEGPVAIQSDTYVDTSTPVHRVSGLIGYLHIGQERRFIDHQMTEIWWDLGTVALVSMLIAFELLLFAMAFLVHVPLSAVARLAREVCAGNFAARIVVRARNDFGQLAAALNARLDHIARICRQTLAQATNETTRIALARLQDRYGRDQAGDLQPVAEDRLILIRWPFFLFIFAESLSLSFFPLYVKQLYTPIPGWSQELVLGLPISIFMLVWALSLPAGGAWSDRVGRRRAFLTGALVAGVGLALAATAQGIWDLILWRSLTALGYGVVFITAQGYVVDYTPAAQRTRGMAMFLATFFGGSLCGAAIGGILAERIGYAPVFWLSALLALIAAAVAGRFLVPPAGIAVAAQPRLRLADLWDLLRNPRFMAVTLLTAIPAKLILTGFLYYAMPLYLSTLALTAGDVGRVMMTYGLAMILLSPLVGYLADAWGRRAGFVTVGGLLAAVAILLLELKTSVLLAVFGITLLGAAQAIGVSPQLSLVMDVSRIHSERMGAGTVMGIFRLMERLGNVLGPIVLALLIGTLGFDGAFLALGLYALLSVALFGLIWLAFAHRDRRTASSQARVQPVLHAERGTA